MRLSCLKKKVFSIVIYLSVFMALFALPVHAKEPNITKATEWIFIGDSYSVRPVNRPEKTWPAQLQDRLNLADEKVFFVQKPGYGFSRPNYQFITALRKLKPSNNIKKIVIVGGATNDYYRSYRTIKNDLLKVDKLLERKYPNANVYYAAPSWRLAPSFHTRLYRHKKWYKALCQKAGWYYLDAPQDVLVNHPEWFESDGHHPNIGGLTPYPKKYIVH